MSSGIEDEPALNGIAPGGGSEFDSLYGEDALAGTEAAEADRGRHRARLRAMWSEPPSARRAAFVLGVCAVSGLLAVACALFKGTIGAFVLSVTVGAPVVEEMAKVALALWALEKSPWKFRSAVEIVLACIASAAVFAVIENALYIFVYIPEDRLTSGILLYRLIVCTSVHILCTSIASVGLARGWREAKARLGEFEKSRAMPFLVAAMVLHGLHNAGAVLWSVGRVQRARAPAGISTNSISRLPCEWKEGIIRSDESWKGRWLALSDSSLRGTAMRLSGDETKSWLSTRRVQEDGYLLW